MPANARGGTFASFSASWIVSRIRASTALGPSLTGVFAFAEARALKPAP
jgi:hypothetical protein